MKKIIWMNPEGELIECLSHNEYAIELISNSEETKELNIDYDYPYQLLHKLGWVRIDIKQNMLTYDITQLITGNVGFDYISEEWANGDALECLNIAIFFDLFIYLIEKGII